MEDELGVAVFDTQQNVLVISVVYDGPPKAGKTTSLQSLSKSLSRPLYTPEEVDGRTSYFDSMEYTGGRFEGAAIRCQVLSVPGQKIWADRRRLLLEKAEVVVFVGDTSPAGWPSSLERLRELRADLDRRSGPPVGVVFQANKRDSEGAVPLATIREELGSGGWNIGIVESVASEGTGIREGFVFAVRLALDRVRELQSRGELNELPSSLRSADELLEEMKMLTAPRMDLRYSTLPAPVQPAIKPLAPSPDAPSGLIWPPIEGRIILHEATDGLKTMITSRGDCIALDQKLWRVHSRSRARYTELEDGRAALIAWARLHASNLEMISKRRCLVLVESGFPEDGGERSSWRLWQIIRVQKSLESLLVEALHGSAEELEVCKTECARLLIEAQQRLIRSPLPCTLDTIGRSELGTPVFVGLMPAPDERPFPPCDQISVKNEIEQLIARRRLSDSGSHVASRTGG